MMFCITIGGPSYQEAKQQLQEIASCSHIAEVRLDLLESIDIQKITELLNISPLPILLTIRSSKHGGKFTDTRQRQEELIEQLAQLHPAYLDVEEDLSPSLIKKLLKCTRAQLILSHHNITHTPENLNAIWQKLLRYKTNYYKVATYAHNTCDACRVLLSAYRQQNSTQLIAIAMGLEGQISRILAPIMGQSLIYTCSKEESAAAPGQIDIATLKGIYQHNTLNPNSHWYALLGDPVSHSFGHLAHNAVYTAMGIDAVYVKIRVEKETLSTLIPMLKEMNCSGFSVTRPHKEAVLSLLDEIDTDAKALGAVNTVVRKGSRFIGYNTDGIGALDALEAKGSVSGRHLVILGAGGAARAIAYTAIQRGAQVTIVNRTFSKAELLAYQCGNQSKAATFQDMTQLAYAGYDIIVNTTPINPPIPSEYILEKAIAMDINNKPMLTPFLQMAKQRGSSLVFGYEMFVRQATGQAKLWFPSLNTEKTYDVLLEKSLKALDE